MAEAIFLFHDQNNTIGCLSTASASKENNNAISIINNYQKFCQ